MIERPTNDESYRRMRGEVLDQLRERFRRARSECPVVTPDDITQLRNVVRPALDQTKIGTAGRDYLARGPLLPLLLKEAGVWDNFTSNLGDAWGYLKGQAGEAGKALTDAGRGLMGEGETGSWWDSSKPWYSNLLGDAGKVFDTVSAPGKALYNLGQGVVGGGIAAASPDALDAIRTSRVGKGLDRAAEWVAGDVPFVLGTGGAGLLARSGAAAIPKLVGRVGTDIAAATAIPAVINKAQGGGLVESLQLPWSDKPLVEEVGLPLPAQQAAPAAPTQAPDYGMSGLYNKSYWGGGGLPLPVLQGANKFFDQLQGFVPGPTG